MVSIASESHVAATGSCLLLTLYCTDMSSAYCWLQPFCCVAGKYLEIFGRKNNLRNYWVTVGNEVTGTGLPADDEVALKANKSIPGAVYGARN